ncbi:hypothetical protein GCM10027572_09660 [Flexivirga lutea]
MALVRCGTCTGVNVPSPVAGTATGTLDAGVFVARAAVMAAVAVVAECAEPVAAADGCAEAVGVAADGGWVAAADPPTGLPELAPADWPRPCSRYPDNALSSANRTAAIRIVRINRTSRVGGEPCIAEVDPIAWRPARD